MSLTKDEWMRMWESIKVIERYYVVIENPYTHDRSVDLSIREIKQKIQQVIGQME